MKMKKTFVFTVLSTAMLLAGNSVAEELTGIADMAQALPDAKAGECFAKVMIPAQYKTEAQEIVKRDAYDKIEIIPAKYETVQEKVLVREASKKIVPVPAVYGMVEETVELEPAKMIWMAGNSKKSRVAGSSLLAGAHALSLPDTAKPGECFKEYHSPAQYKTEAQKILQKEASKKFEIIPAKYETVVEKVMVSEASSKLVEVPAEYEKVTEKVLVRAAYTTWKQGRGPVERIDGGTGEIMCKVEVPAKYKSITRRVLKTPATTSKVEIPAKFETQKVRKLVAAAAQKEIEIPATYETVTKRVKISDSKTAWLAGGSATEDAGKATGKTLCMKEVSAKTSTVKRRVVKTPATVKTVEIPAVFETRAVRKLVSPPEEKRTKIPAEKQSVSKRIKVTDAKLEWRSVLCQTNMTKDLNLQIQKALQVAGYNPGPVDGVIGRQTLLAVDAFQQKNDLPTGGLTMATLEKLGVKL
ncbi:MAG: peptidoglycan-binding domain-containing protein [Gammaproteobacteria bacterium]